MGAPKGRGPMGARAETRGGEGLGRMEGRMDRARGGIRGGEGTGRMGDPMGRDPTIRNRVSVENKIFVKVFVVNCNGSFDFISCKRSKLYITIQNAAYSMSSHPNTAQTCS